MTFEAVLPLLLGPAGLVVGLIIALIAAVRGSWHTDQEFRSMEKRALKAEARAERVTIAALKAGGVGSALLDVMRDRVDPAADGAE